MKTIYFICLCLVFASCGGNLRNTFKAVDDKKYPKDAKMEVDVNNNASGALFTYKMYHYYENDMLASAETQEVSVKKFMQVAQASDTNRITQNTDLPKFLNLTDVLLLHLSNFEAKHNSGSVIYATSLRVFDPPYRKYDKAKEMGDSTSMAFALKERSYFVRKILAEEKVSLNSFSNFRIGRWYRRDGKIVIQLPAQSDEASTYFQMIGHEVNGNLHITHVSNPSTDLLSRRNDRENDLIEIKDHLSIAEPNPDDASMQFQRNDVSDLYMTFLKRVSNKDPLFEGYDQMRMIGRRKKWKIEEPLPVLSLECKVKSKKIAILYVVLKDGKGKYRSKKAKVTKM